MRVPVAPLSCQVPRPIVGIFAPFAFTVCMSCVTPFLSARAPLPRLAGHNIGPERLDLLGFQHVTPRRHLVLAAGDRVDETFMLIARKLAQVERAFGVLHARAVAGGAVALEDLRT